MNNDNGKLLGIMLVAISHTESCALSHLVSSGIFRKCYEVCRSERVEPLKGGNDASSRMTIIAYACVE